MTLSGPEQVLLRAGQHLHRLGELSVAGDLPMVVAIGAHKICEDLGIATVGLRTRHCMTVAVAADSVGVDRVDDVPGSDQTLHQQTTVGFNADNNTACIVGVSAHQLLDIAKPFDAVRYAERCQPAALLTDDADIVVLFCPIDAEIDHRFPP